MKHPCNRAERRAVRDGKIARRKYIATRIWRDYDIVPHEGSPLYKQHPNWYQPIEWGRFAKFNLNCGCMMCHSKKYFSEKRKRREALKQSISYNIREWAEIS
jgi:hypothetical protein